MGHEMYERFKREHNQKELERLVEESRTRIYRKPLHDLQAKVEQMQRERKQIEPIEGRKQSKPTKGSVIRIQDNVRGISMTAVVDDISKDGTRMTLSKLKEDE